ncbi:MAG: ATP-grasp domain-containing protein [Candidatus Nezhaarchaeales archaeon]|nr:MAG: D-alanine--D-alanine ligase [Candidatus Nezhaarchaeota archaeon WYZ-LMO8]TDA35876.1 MAG: D-alanine--D-alanine ligase [Candidatus Nezhaarchaeota archaeon WYZ-LMO7]
MTLRVGLTYNLRRKVEDNSLPEDYYVEYDDESTVDAIASALRKGGCKVIKIEANEEAYIKLCRCRPDIVFNIAEGLRGESRESHIPAILEMLGIPYTGSSSSTLAICLDKALTHKVLSAYGVPSPKFQVFKRPDEKLSGELEFPLVVKPLLEGSSKGIRNSSLVRDEYSLRRQVSWVIKTYNQPAIVEEFMPGREFTVGLIGNEEPVVLPIVEIHLERLPNGANPIYSYEAKWVWDTPERPLDIFECPARIPSDLKREVEEIAIKTFNVLNCRDLCRIDMRLDKDGVPRVLEVNPLPGLIPDPRAHSCLPEAARALGFTYDELICTILWQALKRYGMQQLFKNKSLVKIP